MKNKIFFSGFITLSLNSDKTITLNSEKFWTTEFPTNEIEVKQGKSFNRSISSNLSNLLNVKSNSSKANSFSRPKVEVSWLLFKIKHRMFPKVSKMSSVEEIRLKLKSNSLNCQQHSKCSILVIELWDRLILSTLFKASFL